ncbi:MAG TPA: aminotransferase class I/II-fold pyridoxal phosphate-dependent enzyme [Planctomycetota bacterium]|nr:aminotransferase class I/II-fold pyridoxal phosphate-dependent enzyme [Planctomycetota bacterium]
MDVEGLIRRSISGMQPPTYPGPEAGLLRMDANTNLIGRNPAIDRAAKRVSEIDLAQYPTCLSDDLRSAIAREHGLESEEVLVGGGSDEVLDVLCRAFLNPGDVVACATPSFVMYAFFGRLHFGKVVEVPLRRPDWALDVEALLGVKAKLTFVASPNNPTGNAVPAADLERLLAGSTGLVLVDEAYADFCGQDFASRVRRFENLVVSRTFSKSHGLAGLRVGYGVANRPVMERMYGAKTPLTLSAASEAIALESLADPSFVRETVAGVQRERARLAGRLADLGFRPQRTDANFMLVDLGEPSGPLAAFLRSKGVVTRPMGDIQGLGDFLRVTVGRPEHTDRLVALIREYRS